MGAFDEPYSSRQRYEQDWRPDYNRGGRFGERADYEYDEPRYGGYSQTSGYNQPGGYNQQGRSEGRRSSLYDVRGDLSTGRWRDREYRPGERSRLRCRDIMTRDLAIATRDTPLTQVALMMKQEDTGVIPVVEYDVTPGNGRTENDDRRYDGRNYSRGKLLGLITDRDIVIRAVAEGKDCTQARAEDIMTVDVHTAHPNDRVVDAIRKMGDKQVRRIPVCNENGYLVGMISMADVAVETREDHELQEALEDISKGTSFWNRIFG
jgi:CBS domain-containing protein